MGGPNPGGYLGEISLLFVPCSKTHHPHWLAELYLSVCAKFWNAELFQPQRWSDPPDPPITATIPYFLFIPSFIHSFIYSSDTKQPPSRAHCCGRYWDKTLNRHSFCLCEAGRWMVRVRSVCAKRDVWSQTRAIHTAESWSELVSNTASGRMGPLS